MNLGMCKILTGQAKSVKSVGYNSWTFYLRKDCDNQDSLLIYKGNSWEW